MDKARQIATAIAMDLQQRGHIAVFNGGSVRDEILGRKPKDFDVATSARPDQVLAAIQNKPGQTVKTQGAHFGVVAVTIDGTQTEIATLRGDGQYGDGRRPDSVAFVTSLVEDAKRRDFTVNAMFKDPVTGEVHDYFDGRQDLDRKVIRAVGDPLERFTEDRLRMLRGIRLAARLDFKLDGATKDALTRNATLIGQVSGDRSKWVSQAVAAERVREEFMRMLTETNPRRAMELLRRTGLMRQIVPELAATYGARGLQSPRTHPEGNVWNHTMMVLDELRGSHFELMLGGLLHDVAKPATLIWVQGRHGTRVKHPGHDEVGAEMAHRICRRLKMSNPSTHAVSELVRLHMFMHFVRGASLRQLHDTVSRRDIVDLMKLQRADTLGRGATRRNSLRWCHTGYLRRKIDELKALPVASQRLGAPKIADGLFIQQVLGISPGPLFKSLIDEAYTAQLEGVFIDDDGAAVWLRENHDRCAAAQQKEMAQ